MYQEADRQLAKIQSFLKEEALHLDTMSFDELHSVSTKTVTTKLMKRLKKKNKNSFLLCAIKAYKDAVEIAHKKGWEGKGEDLTEAWLLGYLGDYNYVTGYLYDPESERKRLRLSEAINTAMSFKDRDLYSKEVKRFFSLWWTQTKQYMIGTVDHAETKAWKDLGVKYAMWVTAEDEKVCEECGSMHGQIFPLDEFPEKPHYNCRCRKVPMPKTWKPNGKS